MGKDTNSISCPKCGTEINVNKITYQQVKGQLIKDFEAQNAEKNNDYKKKLEDLSLE